MDTQFETPVEEVRRRMDELVGLLALPAAWTGGDPSQIANALLDALDRILNSEFVCVRLSVRSGGTPTEFTRIAQAQAQTLRRDDLSRALDRSLGEATSTWPVSTRLRVAGLDLGVISAQLGLKGEFGAVIAGSRRPDFPQQADRLVIGVAANQATIALQQATIAERQRAEDELRARERHLRLIVDNVAGFVTTFMPKGELESANRQFLEYTGTTLENAKDWMTNGIVHPDDTQGMIDDFREGFRTVSPYGFERRLRRHDGVYRWFQCRGIPLIDENRRIVRWYALMTDMDDRKRAEDALRRSEARLIEAERDLQLMIDSIPVRVAMYSADGTRVSGNRWIRESLGGTPIDQWNTRVHPDDIALAESKWRACLASGEPFEHEYRWRMPDGTYRWHQSRRVPLRDDTGEIIRWYSAGHDIDDRKRAEDALRQSEARLAATERDLQLTIDTIPVFVAVYKPDGTRSFVNQTWLDYMGLTKEEALGPAARTFPHFHPDDAERNDRAWRTALASGEPLSIEIRVRRADGQYRWHTSRRVPLRDETGEIVRWYSVGIDIEDQKAAEDASRRSEARLSKAERELQLMIDTIPAFVTVFSPDGEREYVNKTWRDNTGLQVEDILGGNWTRIVHPDDQERSDRLWHQAIATGEPLLIEQRIRRHDGQYRWHMGRRVPLRDDTGTILRWYSVAIDIEDQKRAEQALREAERNSRLIVDSIPGLVATFTPDGQFEFVNRQIIDYFGGTAEVRMSREGLREGIHPEDLPGATALFKQAIESGEPFEFEVRGRRVDGVYRWFQSRGVPLRDTSGRIVRWLNLLIDIDERKRAEEKAVEAERELRQTLDSIPTITWRSGPNGYVQQLNKRFFEYTGTAAEEVRGRGWQSCVHPDDLAGLIAIGDEYIPSGRPADAEARLRRHDGEYRWFLFRPAPARNENGEIVGWYGIVTDIEDRKRAEQKVVEAERELQLMIDSLPALVGTFDADGTRLFVNKRTFEVTGLTPEDIPGELWRKAYHPDDVEESEKRWREAVASGEPYECEIRTRSVDGAYRWHLTRRVPVRNEAGNVIRWYSIGHDIQNQKRAEEALRQSEAELAKAERELRVMLDSIPSITWRGAPNGYVQYLNKRWFEYTGTTPEQMRGARWKTCVHPEDIDRLVATGEEYVASGRPIDCEARLRRHDGEYRWFLFRPAPARDENGNVVAWYGTISDIDDRRRAEEELRRSETLLAEGQRLSLTGTFSWLVDTNRVAFSPELHRIFEFEPDAVLTLGRLHERTHPEDRALMDEKANTIRKGLDTPAYEIRLRMPDERLKYVRIMGRVLRRQDGRLECIGAIQDVTQRHNAEAALDKVRSELAHVTRVMTLGALTASIAHEVNQPLAGIVTNASTCLRMLATDPPNVEGARETARRTIRDGNRAADVIARLRALFSKRAFATEMVDLNEATREVITLVSSDLERNRVILRAELDVDPLLVTGDRVQLQQVILNLVRNALESMSGVSNRPRLLAITTGEGADDSARLTVRDAGIGLEQGAERLFDAFYTTKTGGMGIGLAVSRSIIESHGGRLWAEPNDDGPGATFSFSIPRRAPGAGDDSAAGAILTRPATGARDGMRNA